MSEDRVYYEANLTKKPARGRAELFDLMKRRKVTIKELAEALCISRDRMGRILNNKQPATVYEALRLAEILDAEVHRLFIIEP